MLQKSYYIPRTGKREAGAWNARRGRDLQPPPEMNIDHACTETRMCSVAYSSTTHRSYTDEHTTQPRHKTLTPEGSRTGLGVVVHSTVYVYASMEYSVVWYSGLQRWLRSALRSQNVRSSSDQPRAWSVALGAQSVLSSFTWVEPSSRRRVQITVRAAEPSTFHAE